VKRKRFSEEQIVRILQEADRPGKTVADVCRQHGVSENTFYRWRRQFKGLSVADVRTMRQLAQENARLKKLLAERDLEVDALKEVLAKNF
jgi:putative transposase